MFSNMLGSNSMRYCSWRFPCLRFEPARKLASDILPVWKTVP
jgi:hypothetical protein